MSEPFLAEIHIFGFNFAPRGFAQCDGQLLPINQYQSLYSLLGTTYGGDGRTTFCLPDLRGRVPVHVGDGLRQGQRGGEESHTLIISELPAHTHPARGSNADANESSPMDNTWAARPGGTRFGTATPDTTMSATSISTAGAWQGHDNMQPYQVINFTIALVGLFPSRN